MKRIFSGLVLVLISTLLIGQSRTIRFDNLSIENGLSQSSVNTILQDQKGFMWFGTQDGLNCFDGYEFKVFKHDPDNSNTLSNNFIKAMAEDSRGIIWIGTESGGVNSFDPATNTFNRLNVEASIAKSTIEDLLVDQSDNLWIGTKNKGLYKYSIRDSIMEEYDMDQGLYSLLISALELGKDGKIYVGTEGHGLFVSNKSRSRFSNYRNEPQDAHSISGDFIHDITVSHKGAIFIGTNKGLSQFVRDRFHNYHVSDGLSAENVQLVFSDHFGGLWCGYPGFGLDEVTILSKGIQVTNYRHNDFNPRNLLSNIIYCMAEDQTGSLWIGSNGGISKFDPLKQAFQHIKEDFGEDRLLDDNIWAINKDSSGIVWIGTREGVSRIDRENRNVRNYPFQGNNPLAPNNNSVFCIQIDDKAQVWLGTVSGLYQLKTNDSWETAYYEKVKTREAQGADHRVYGMVLDGDKIWLACLDGLSCYDQSTGSYQFFEHDSNNSNSLPVNDCRFIIKDRQHHFWIGTEGGGLVQLELQEAGGETEYIFKTYRPEVSNPNSISSDVVLSIWEEDNGVLWIGTYGGGLNKFDPVTQKFTAYTEKDGLSNNSVYGVIGGEPGTLWLTTNLGACKFDIQEEVFTNFLASDGLQSNEFNTGAFFHSANGELFLGGINGLNAFYPSDIKINEQPPKVRITEILLFNKPIAVSKDGILSKTPAYTDELVLDYTQNNITFVFSALHYTSSEGNKYRYVLEGFEEVEVNGENRREAHYTNLSPGFYTFKVYASNSDGVWAETKTQMKLRITPPFWGTWWFISLMIFFAIMGVFLFFRWRVRSINAQKERLARLVEERTRTVTRHKEKIEEQNLILEAQKKLVEEEKIKADKLLANILPQETAEELKNKGKTRTRTYRRVTVMFTDFKGFTKIAERMKPQELVVKLDSYFRKFDEISEANHIEKIKTIGDSYMAAGGVPLRDKENPINTVIAALQIQAYVKKVKEEQPEDPGDIWDLRIGIHTGEVIAGVIGTKRIAYDIWGNTVNVAARMESSSEPGRVNVSGKTFEIIEPYFDCLYRGKIAAKNKGHIDMYFVNRIKPHLAEDEAGTTPNKLFWDYLNLHVYSAINYRKAERYIMRILRQKLSDKLYYHGIHHTYDVIEAAERLAIMEGVVDEDIFVLKSAATYHDAGFIEQYDANEPVGARLAAEILPKYGYTPEQVEKVFQLIYATRIPHDPQSHLEEIICDADLDYLGRDDFHSISDTLRRELREHGKINSDRLWDEIQVKFLTQHKYFTKSAIKLRQEKKRKHLEEIKQRLIENNYAD